MPRPVSHRAKALAKRDDARPPIVKRLLESRGAAFPAGRMLIASPNEIHGVLARVPARRVVTTGTVRVLLARRFGADYTCPITTGIFLRIAAEAAECERADGMSDALAWWRIVRDDGSLLDTLPGGAGAQARLLEHEGVRVTRVRGVPKKVESLDDVTIVPRVSKSRTAAIRQ
jgi:hypothetical protein